ncbi:Hpt domain-containing protein [Marinobacter lipolyticus]|uniref:Hpt domain-containing protein n=1 Tax=Marinobacter lipolyticus TaxID=209639 RepID=UPI001BCE02F3|nr:Hpt domain-containing protein [Marinobacter lipolyticus]MBS8242134.1 Hpt domain-containing protein [Marinobacter lipolyticus]
MNDRPHLDEEALAELQDVMDEEFDVLIHTYLSDSAERISSLRSALDEGDADALSRTAHSFKGSCLNIGAPRLGALCMEVEEAGRASRLSALEPLLASIESEFRQVRQGLERFLAD